MAVIMLALTLAWATRHTTQPRANTTRTGTVRCDHHSDDDPVGDNFSTSLSTPRSVIGTQA
eukprot:7301960-Prymnesium_polylepis.2